MVRVLAPLVSGNVLIVAPEREVREAWSSALTDGVPGVEVTAAEDQFAAMAMLADVDVLVAEQGGVVDGLALAHSLQRMNPESSTVLVIQEPASRLLISRFVAAGVSSLLFAPVVLDQLAHAVYDAFEPATADVGLHEFTPLLGSPSVDAVAATS